LPLSALEVRVSASVEQAQAILDAKQRKKLAWWFARLKEDVFAGDQIPKDRIPAGLASRNGLPAPPSNAWRFELPGAFRAVYTVQPSSARHPVVLVLEVLSHKEYDRLFGYR
jgi:hypothetical protein